MAPESKKRKATAPAAKSSKKTKKAEDSISVAPVESTRPKRTRKSTLTEESITVAPVAAEPVKEAKKSKKSKKSEEVADDAPAAVEPAKELKKLKKTLADSAETEAATKKAKKTKDAKAPAAIEPAKDLKKLKKALAESAEKKGASKKKETTTTEVSPPKDAADESADADENEEEEDQTEALLKGFESSEEEDVSGDEGFEAGQEVPEIPDDKKMRKKLKGANKDGDGNPGVVYVGRIPHGFYENEMKAYFSQFGEIRRLRLSRNRKTGKSKHYAFIEFGSSEVARIVADTMNNYLMFGHILKCKLIAKEQVHASLWKGANRRFKAVPWNKLEGRKLRLGMDREGWSKRIESEQKRRKGMEEKLKAIGYEFEVPEVKSVDDVPKKEPKLLEPKESVIEETTIVVEKEEPNSLIVTEEVTKKVEAVAEEKKTKETKKPKKGKKASK